MEEKEKVTNESEEQQPLRTTPLTIEEISKAAYTNTPIDDMALNIKPYERTLWKDLAFVYDKVRRGEMTKERGRAAKKSAIEEYYNAKKVYDAYTRLFTRIERAGTAYAKNRTLENADAFYKAVYGVEVRKETE